MTAFKFTRALPHGGENEHPRLFMFDIGEGNDVKANLVIRRGTDRTRRN